MTAREVYAVPYQYIMDHGLDGSRLGYYRFIRFKYGLPLIRRGMEIVVSKMVIGTEKDRGIRRHGSLGRPTGRTGDREYRKTEQQGKQ